VGHLELDTAVPIPRPRRWTVLDAIDDLCREISPGDPPAGRREVLTRWIPAVLGAVAESYREAMRPPLLQTTDGEEMLFCAARYRVLDDTALVAALDRHRSFDRQEGGYVWLSGHRRKGMMGPGRIGLGNIILKKGEAVLEARSRERLVKGKALLEKIAGPFLEHRADSFEDPMQAIKRLPAEGIEAPSRIPPEVEQEALARFHAEYDRKWLDMPLPALDGMTPRKAAADPGMRPRLVELLKDFENDQLRTDRKTSDVAWLRDQLGLRGDE
jgi:hypothetical protein